MPPIPDAGLCPRTDVKESWRLMENDCPPAELSISPAAPEPLAVCIRPYKRPADAMGPRAFQKCPTETLVARPLQERGRAGFVA
jgi:hypothetical protein